MTGKLNRVAIYTGDRQLRRVCVRFGEELRAMRLRAGVSQAAVARGIGVARSVICRIEQGDQDVSLRIRARAAALLGADLGLALYPAAAPLIRDAAHARIIEQLLAQTHPSWRPSLEAPVPGPGRRSTDVRLGRDRDVVLIEVETRIHTLEQIIRECTEKRAAMVALLPAGHRAHAVLAIPASAHHRALVGAHPRILSTAFPVRSERIEAALADPAGPWPGDGILWVPTS